jgi:hypothetical protein
MLRQWWQETLYDQFEPIWPDDARWMIKWISRALGTLTALGLIGIIIS